MEQRSEFVDAIVDVDAGLAHAWPFRVPSALGRESFQAGELSSLSGLCVAIYGGDSEAG